MEQKQFTSIVINKILEHIPQFKDYCFYKPDDVVDVEYKSPGDNIELWITTQNKEITIGFDDKDKLHNWHFHITSYDEELILEDVKEAIIFIEGIIYDKYDIIYSNLLGYSIYDAEGKNQAIGVGEKNIINKWGSW